MNEGLPDQLRFGEQSVDDATFARIGSKSIFFAHHSVGSNILDGVADLMAPLPDKPLKITQGTDVTNNGVLYHTGVGTNGDPLSKIQGFVSLVRNGVGDKADVAFFKFCYVDFTPNTDAQALFERYSEEMRALQESYRHTCFVHVTVPLTTQKEGLKTVVKRFLGRINWDHEANLVRERFNRLIREEYAEAGLVFDLARVESTLPDGTRLQFELHGETYYALAPEYTTDGGHLNELGRKRAAEELLKLLGSLE